MKMVPKTIWAIAQKVRKTHTHVCTHLPLEFLGFLLLEPGFDSAE